MKATWPEWGAWIVLRNIPPANVFLLDWTHLPAFYGPLYTFCLSLHPQLPVLYYLLIQLVINFYYLIIY